MHSKALGSARDKLIIGEARCIVWLSDGKQLSVLEPCDTVKRLMNEAAGRCFNPRPCARCDPGATRRAATHLGQGLSALGYAIALVEIALSKSSEIMPILFRRPSALPLAANGPESLGPSHADPPLLSRIGALRGAGRFG